MFKIMYTTEGKRQEKSKYSLEDLKEWFIAVCKNDSTIGGWSIVEITKDAKGNKQETIIEEGTGGAL